MKIRFKDRLALIGGGFLSILSGVFMVLIGLQGLDVQVNSRSLRIFCIVLGAMTIFFGFYLFTFHMKLDEKYQRYLERHSPKRNKHARRMAAKRGE